MGCWARSAARTVQPERVHFQTNFTSLETDQNSRSLGVLTPDPQSPVVPQSSVRPDLLEPLEVITELLVDGVGKGVGVLALEQVLLPVQEPSRDLELGRVLHDGNDSLELIGVELSGTDISVCS